MIEFGLLETGLLLGLYVLLAGTWGLLYAVARLWSTAMFRSAAAAVYGLHGLTALAVIMRTPLGMGWKCLIAASSLAFLAIPPIAWRFLQHIHENESSANDRKSSPGSGRVVARL
jgi:hypothetical protein